MAKKKDLGELVQIRYILSRDTLVKFKKILRKVFSEEKRNLVIDMVVAPEIPSDYLDHLVYTAQALKMQGYTITFLLNPLNYIILKNSQHKDLYILKRESSPSQEEANEPIINENTDSQLQMPGMTIRNNVMHIEDEELDDFQKYFDNYISEIITAYSTAIIDITKLKNISSKLVHFFIMKTIKHGESFFVQLSKEQKKVILKNSQAAVLNLKVFFDKKNAFRLDFSEESAVVLAEKKPVPEKTKQAPILEKQKESPVIEEIADAGEPFKLSVNTLECANISPSTFIDHFDSYVKKLDNCGSQVFLDFSNLKVINFSILEKSFQAFISMGKKDITLGFKMLKTQTFDWQQMLPKSIEVEKKFDTGPQFNISGSRLEIKNVEPKMFLNEFPMYFQKLLSGGNSSIHIDISNLQELSTQCIDLLVLSYLDAVGRNRRMELRISPEIEELFKKSGRARSIPLEIVKPGLTKKSTLFSGGKVKGVDMSKIEEAINSGDKLTNKVLEKEFVSTMHIETRGSVQNWEPVAMTANDVQEKYSGSERRLERRYSGLSAEISFARGSIGKITDRRYRINNISQSGLSFAITSQLSRGEPVKLKIYYENNPGIEIAANVVWVSPVASQALFRMGVKYKNLNVLLKSQVLEILKSIHTSS